jgi:hypothetical protein
MERSRAGVTVPRASPASWARSVSLSRLRFSAEEVGEHAQVHLGAGRFAVLAVFDDEDLAVGPRCVRAVPENAAHVVIVPVVDDPREHVAPRAGR